MASSRSAGGGGILWLTMKSIARSFQSTMTSARLGCARHNTAMAIKALGGLAFMILPPDCDRGESRENLAATAQEVTTKFRENSGKSGGEPADRCRSLGAPSAGLKDE